MAEKEEPDWLERPTITHRAEGLEAHDVTKWLLNYKDVFVMSYLYMLVHEWLIEEGYANRKDEEFPETFYLERATPAGKEIWVRWRMKRRAEEEQKMYEYRLDLDFHALTLKDVDVMHKGEKYKANKGEIEITCEAKLVIDPDGEWRNHWFLKHFKNLIIYRLQQKKFDWHKAQVYQHAQRLQEAIKTYLKIETYLPEREGGEFWEKRTME